MKLSVITYAFSIFFFAFLQRSGTIISLGRCVFSALTVTVLAEVTYGSAKRKGYSDNWGGRA